MLNLSDWKAAQQAFASKLPSAHRFALAKAYRNLPLTIWKTRTNKYAFFQAKQAMAGFRHGTQ